MEQKNVHLLWCSLLLLVAWLILLQNPRSIETFSDAVPKILWTYWDGPQGVPPGVMLCISSWRRFHPRHSIRVLTPQKIPFIEPTILPPKYAQHPIFHDSQARFADLLRLCMLAHYGGTWVDASCIMEKPLDDWLWKGVRPDVDFVGYYLDAFSKHPRYPVIESWFFSCKPKSAFVVAWRDEFFRLAEFPGGVREYVQTRQREGILLDGIPEGAREYLAIHVSAQTVIQRNPDLLHSMVLRKAEDGPYRYLTEAEWKSDEGIRRFCDHPRPAEGLIKLRSHERKSMIARLVDMMPCFLFFSPK